MVAVPRFMAAICLAASWWCWRKLKFDGEDPEGWLFDGSSAFEFLKNRNDVHSEGQLILRKYDYTQLHKNLKQKLQTKKRGRKTRISGCDWLRWWRWWWWLSKDCCSNDSLFFLKEAAKKSVLTRILFYRKKKLWNNKKKLQPEEGGVKSVRCWSRWLPAWMKRRGGFSDHFIDDKKN